jgi:hypothetical protein
VVWALAQFLPRLAARIPSVPLGDWPTPITPVEIDGRTLWVKDEGASNTLYGGNKIRTLEVWFGHAHERGARRIWAIGAYGSNHAIATVVHANTANLEAGAILFPQPSSEWAIENCSALVASGAPLIRVPNVALMPFVALRIARRERDSIIMPPGGATPIGTMGALSGALELATQIEAGQAPPPKRIVVGVGSTCTIAGLVAGVRALKPIERMLQIRGPLTRTRDRRLALARPDRSRRARDAVARDITSVDRGPRPPHARADRAPRRPACCDRSTRAPLAIRRRRPRDRQRLRSHHRARRRSNSHVRKPSPRYGSAPRWRVLGESSGWLTPLASRRHRTAAVLGE